MTNAGNNGVSFQQGQPLPTQAATAAVSALAPKTQNGCRLRNQETEKPLVEGWVLHDGEKAAGSLARDAGELSSQVPRQLSGCFGAESTKQLGFPANLQADRRVRNQSSFFRVSRLTQL